MSKLLMLLGGATTVAALAFRAPTDVARATRSELSVWDSVYTDSQAVRGDSLYKESCAKCHGPSLAGPVRRRAIRENPDHDAAGQTQVDSTPATGRHRCVYVRAEPLSGRHENP